MPCHRGQRKRPQAIVFSPRDNVATSLADLKQGTKVQVAIGKTTISLMARQAIPLGHKIALRDVRKRAWITKYGERIGRAKRVVRKGDHVHTHNLESAKDRLTDRKVRRRQR